MEEEDELVEIVSPEAATAHVSLLGIGFPSLPQQSFIDAEYPQNVPTVIGWNFDEHGQSTLLTRPTASARVDVADLADRAMRPLDTELRHHQQVLAGNEANDGSSRPFSTDVISINDSSSDRESDFDVADDNGNNVTERSFIDTVVNVDDNDNVPANPVVIIGEDDHVSDPGVAITIRRMSHVPESEVWQIVQQAMQSGRSSQHLSGDIITSASHSQGAVNTNTISSTSVTSDAANSPLVNSPPVIEPHNQSTMDFRSPKRRRIISPPVMSAADNKTSEEEDDGDSCPICFDLWTTSGSHRLISLKCGHLFGQSCIEKWLKGQGGKCPQCNAKAKRQDIRVLYAKSVKALDTTERDRALKELEKERELRRRAEMEGAQLRLQFQMAVEDTNQLRIELENVRAQFKNASWGHQTGGVGFSCGTANTSVAKSSQSQIVGQFVLDKSIKIWDAGNCRVIAYSPSLATLVASQPSSIPLFPGFGVRKISALDFKTCQYLTLHSKAIRDVAFHPSVDDGILLSCGLDKKVKMTSLLSNAVIQSYDTPMPAWSCVWNADDRNYFYAGLQNGLVLEFDIRNTEGPVQEFNNEGNRSPVASLCYLCTNMNAQFRSGGLFIGQLDRVSFYEKLTANQNRLHIMPLEGSLTSLSVEHNTRHVLASYRPTARHPTIRHQLCELISRNISADPSVIDHVCSSNVIHTFHGGRTQTVLSKATLLLHPGDRNRLLICAGDETNSSVQIWDSGTGQLTQQLSTGGVTVDMCSFVINNSEYLAALTDKLCKIFKWT